MKIGIVRLLFLVEIAHVDYKWRKSRHRTQINWDEATHSTPLHVAVIQVHLQEERVMVLEMVKSYISKSADVSHIV